MELLIIAFILIINGAYCAHLSSIISSLSQEELNNLNTSKAKIITRLRKLNLHYEETHNAFVIFEILMYMLASVITGAIIMQAFGNWLFCIYGIVGLFALAFFLRSFLYAIGKRFSSKLIIPLSSILYFYSILNQPFISLIIAIDKLFGNTSIEEPSREELNAWVETAHEEGAIEPGEYRILKNIIHFSEVLVSDVMTPRTVVFSCEADKTIEEIINLPEIRMYSRFPIWEGESLDDGVVGYVTTKDLFYSMLNGSPQKKLRDFSREVHFIPENAELDKALESFLHKRQHLFLVVDEYGGIEGLLTMEDVMETILGVEIMDEADKVADLRVLAKQHRDKRVATIHSRENI